MDDSMIDPLLATAFRGLVVEHSVSEPDDDELVERLVRQHRRTGTRQRVRVGIGVGTALAAGLLLALNLSSHEESPTAPSDSLATAGEAVVKPALELPTTPPPDFEHPGQLFVDSRELTTNDPLPIGRWLHTRADGACTNVPGQAKLCLDANTKVRLVERKPADETTGPNTPLFFELSQGRVTVASAVHPEGVAVSGSESVVLTPLGEVRGGAGEYSVELTAELLSVQVVVGGAHITRHQGEYVHLRPGERVEFVPTAAERAKAQQARRSRRKPARTTDSGAAESRTPASAQEISHQAEAQLRLRNYAAAAELYDDLARQHPRDPAGRRALVALGQLYLDRLSQPRRALELFERYLANPGGAVAQEAAYGKIRALIAMDEPNKSERAIDAFLSAYPKSAYASQLRRHRDGAKSDQGTAP